RYYLPYCFRTESLGPLHRSGTYQLVVVSAGKSHIQPALDKDVQPGTTPQPTGKPLPFALSDEAATSGIRFLFREAPRRYSNPALHAWIVRWIYGGQTIWQLFSWQLVFGFGVLLIQLPISIPKDMRRLKDLRYGRRLKGPVL